MLGAFTLIFLAPGYKNEINQDYNHIIKTPKMMKESVCKISENTKVHETCTNC
jgi:hypothetical protein